MCVCVSLTQQQHTREIRQIEKEMRRRDAHNDYKYYYNKPPRISVHGAVHSISHRSPCDVSLRSCVCEWNTSHRKAACNVAERIAWRDTPRFHDIDASKTSIVESAGLVALAFAFEKKRRNAILAV